MIPNEHEHEQLGGAGRLFDLGVEAVVTTLGSAGVDVETPAGHHRIEPFAVTPIDTTGAGDAFCGAFAVAIAEGRRRTRRRRVVCRGRRERSPPLGVGAVPSVCLGAATRSSDRSARRG